MMKDVKKDFIEIFSHELLSGNVAVFAGAGLSVSSGFIDWKSLLKDFAKKINLDIEQEEDYISIAQYYKNCSSSQHGISQKIVNAFTKNAQYNETLDFITSLPISTFWTTNYDTLIEDSLKKHKKVVDIKINNEDLAISRPNKDVTVYKLHGDVNQPYNAIITKDDYELFDTTHALFISSLQGELITKTFIFIGYSLKDPNIKHILSKIRILMGTNTRTHYLFRKKISEKDFQNIPDAKKAYEYAQIKQDLEIQDLKRYSIETILIDDYKDILKIFKIIGTLYLSRSVFVAGSCRSYDTWNDKEAISFLHLLGYKLIKKNIAVSNGNVEGVGPQLINGVLTAILEDKKDISKYLKIKSLPLVNGTDKHMDINVKKNFQYDMINEAGIIIFVFGNQFYNDRLEISKGVLHDFDRAKEQGRFIIPVISTGWAAQKIYDEIKNDKKYSYLNKFIDRLSNDKDPDKLSDTVIECIEYIQNDFILETNSII